MKIKTAWAGRWEKGFDHELNPKPGKDEPVQIIWDMPGPDRNRDPKPDNNNPQREPTYADVRT